jgi:hypothetical protein
LTELEDINLLTEPLNEKVHKSMATKAVPNAKKRGISVLTEKNARSMA